MVIEKLITGYSQQIINLKREVSKELLKVGTSDSAKESRYPTGVQERETEISYLRERLFHYNNLVKELKSLPLNITKSNKVCIGTTATLMINNDSNLEVLLLKNNGDLNNGVISVKSPIGKAIFGKKVGETVTLENNSKVITLKIACTY